MRLSLQTVRNLLLARLDVSTLLLLVGIVGKDVGLVERVLGRLLELLVQHILHLVLSQAGVLLLQDGHLALNIGSKGGLEATLGVAIHVLALASGNRSLARAAGRCTGERQQIQSIVNVGSRELLNRLDLVREGLGLLGLLDGLLLLALEGLGGLALQCLLLLFESTGGLALLGELLQAFLLLGFLLVGLGALGPVSGLGDFLIGSLLGVLDILGSSLAIVCGSNYLQVLGHTGWRQIRNEILRTI